MTPTPQPSDAAKAAAIMCFTSGIKDYNQALQVYNALHESEAPVDEVLDNFPGVVRWSAVDHMFGADWWFNVVELADSIDGATQHFAQKKGAV